MSPSTKPIERLPASMTELIANASIEISPRSIAQVEGIAQMLPVNSCVYVPAPASRPLSETLAAVAAIKRAGLDPVPHVAARRFASRLELTEFLAAAVIDHGAHRVLLIAGDETRQRGPYADSVAVLEDGILAELGVHEVGIAGYPEGHMRIPGSELDKAFERKIALARAQELGVYVVTQFSFSPARITAYCTELAVRAPQVSVYVGMAGPADPLALMRYAQLCGVSSSLRAMRNLGSNMIGLATHADPQEQLLALARYSEARSACNIVGIHLFSFGGALRTADWLHRRLNPQPASRS